MSSKKQFLTPTVVRIMTTTLILIYFVLSVLEFFIFEKSLWLKIGFGIIFFASLAEIIIIRRALGFLILTIYLTFFSLLNFNYSGLLPTWLIAIIVVPLILSLVSLWKKTNRMSWKRQDTLLWILISLMILEGLAILSFISFSPYMWSFLMLLIPILSLDIYSDYREEIISPKRILRITFIVGLAILILIFSSPKGLM